MSYTRANAESALVSRTSKKMALVDFDITTTGENVDLEDPFATALRKMGKTIIGSTVANADLALLDDGEIDEFLGRAELRLLENIAGNIDLTDIKVGQRSESLGQLATQVENAITRLTARLQREYGVGAAPLVGGTLMLDFQQDDECE